VAGSRELLRRLEHGEIDVAIGFHNAAPPGNFSIRTLTTEPLVLIGRKGGGEQFDLSDRKFVVTETGCIYRRIFDEVFAKSGIASPKLAAEVESIGAIINFVATSSSLGLVPRLAAESALQIGKIEELSCSEILSPAVPLTMVCRRRSVQPTALRQFLDAAAVHFAPLRSGGGRLRHEEQSPL